MDTPNNVDREPAADSGEPDFTLAEPDGIGETERILRSRVYPPVTHDVSRGRSGRQFSLVSILVMIFFMGLGLAGRSWMPAPVFAGAMGVLAFLSLIWVVVRSPQSLAARLIWWGIILAYVTAIASSFIPQPT